MPSQILHTLFGEDVCAGIFGRLSSRFGKTTDAAMRKIQTAHKRIFALGCQGPDIFYHNRGSRPVGLEYGTLLHRRGIGSFSAELLAVSLPSFSPRSGGARFGALGVYALGFMTHAALDRAAHPYIVYKSGWLMPAKPETLRFERSHPFFERIIDVLMLKRLRGMEAAAWDQGALLAKTCKIPPWGLKKLLSRSLAAVFPERAGKDKKLHLRIQNTFTDCAFFYRVTSPAQTRLAAPGSVYRKFPPNKRQLAFLFPQDLPERVDFLNMDHAPWYSPAGSGSADKRSFPEIYAEAVNAAVDSLAGIIGRYLEEGAFPAEEAALAIGNGGLSIVDEAGKPCAPVRSDPLPLDEVLEAEAARRGIFA